MSSDHGCSMSHLHLSWSRCPRPVGNRPWNGHAGYLEAVTNLLESRIFAKQAVRSRGELCQKLNVRVHCLDKTGCLPDRFTWFELSKPKLKVTHCRKEMLRPPAVTSGEGRD